ncbi:MULTISPECIES: vWA domain-containing protein [unclassified Sphingobium]|uniref:vWA domain-containing protein n=1 Tax=unclassified Sphingobium TaxID=2611147 RepID=UPI000D16A646|nr:MULTISPECIES: RNA-binding protein [unclassified Sphingobium]MBG6118200.1 60 kDa SS-A/Ro ribonucleoprotein [Sphingobium sp. JAI105]PSO10009.1 RNA-binding protein [Sphingobium sp. AEW4]TWC98299.1 60 kDa SS-A/Ro ribonucleoprotein [Sphingobium sp. AEW010]TWD18289.1 60 kDa SS-A/Ro ribonucleoprotein [Sphingobium sp. AEW013]TWD20796.1 60 kDa SS-A/Ro ribonucleoprotein [Sphingobium sp. AEW001]
MANKSLFASALSRFLPRADTVNQAGGSAYAYGPEARLAQLAVTGTLADGFYSNAETQLADVVLAAKDVDPDWVAKCAVYSRKSGAMKDMPALLAAYLTMADPDLSVRVFKRVTDNGRMLRTFVQIMRSGQVGRASLGSRPKRLVREWLEQASMAQLMHAATGNDPSLADIVKMVHPAPASAERRAFYGWLIAKPYDVAALPPEIAAFEAWKRAPQGELPQVPFEWLTAFPLSAEQWGVLANRMGWQALRMNLNTLARNGAFAVDGVTEAVAARLADAQAIASVRPMPYQLMVAMGQVGDGVPLTVQAALESALEASLASVPSLEGQVVVCPDVSGSMSSPATGYRKGASSKVRCIDIAALVAAAVLRQNRDARVIPFEQTVVKLKLDPYARLAVNAAKLAGVGGGGTNVSAPLALLNKERARVDTVVIVSDNESWVDPSRRGATATMAEWNKLKARNPGAKLICIDIQPYGSTQAKDSADIVNVGGFTDAVFDAMARFASGQSRDWVEIVQNTEV